MAFRGLAMKKTLLQYRHCSDVYGKYYPFLIFHSQEPARSAVSFDLDCGCPSRKQFTGIIIIITAWTGGKTSFEMPLGGLTASQEAKGARQLDNYYRLRMSNKQNTLQTVNPCFLIGHPTVISRVLPKERGSA